MSEPVSEALSNLVPEVRKIEEEVYKQVEAIIGLGAALARYERALRRLEDCMDNIDECLCLEPPDNEERDNPSAHSQYCYHYMQAVVKAALVEQPLPE